MLVAAFHREARMQRKRNEDDTEQKKQCKAMSLRREPDSGTLAPVSHEVQLHGLSLGFERYLPCMDMCKSVQIWFLCKYGFCANLVFCSLLGRSRHYDRMVIPMSWPK